MPNVVVLIVIGGSAGFLAGLLGAGGGFATVVLLLAAGVGAHDAVGTSLVFTVIVGAWGTVLHLRQGTASWWLAAALGLSSALTAVFGATLGDSLSEAVLIEAFAGLTLAVGILLIFDPKARKHASRVAPISGAQIPIAAPLISPSPGLVAGAIAGGAGIGILKGLFGVGGGFLLVPFMLLVLRVPERLAVGSSLFAILLGSIAGGARHAFLGNVDWGVVGVLIPGGLVGSFLGARLLRTVRPPTIRKAFIALMLVSAVYLLARALF